jgi:polysaccharide export outer membrane protein
MTRKRKKLICLLVVITYLVGGCSVPYREITTRKLTYKGRENRLQAIHGTYRIGAADILSISVVDNPESSKPSRIRSDGVVSVDLIGDVYLEGLTPREAGDKLHKLFQQYLRDLPREAVGVEVVGFYSKKIYVYSYGIGGREVPFTGDTTILDAVIASGLLTLTSAPRRVMIIRGEPDPEKLPKMLKVNMVDIIVKGRNNKNIPLRDKDIVYIPASVYGRIAYGSQLIFMPLSPILGLGSLAGRAVLFGPTSLIGFGAGGVGGGGFGGGGFGSSGTGFR